MVIKYFGRTTEFKGHTLWEIVGNLQNFGVGRMVIRNKMQRYPEPTYMRILKVLPEEASTDEYNRPRKVIALVERVFRGVKSKYPIQIHSTSYKPDYVLIPKDQEHKYESSINAKEKILPKYLDLPPLLQEYIKRTTPVGPNETVPEEKLKCKLRINITGQTKYYRLAEEGETPTVNISLGLGKPASPNLYANVRFEG